MKLTDILLFIYAGGFMAGMVTLLASIFNWEGFFKSGKTYYLSKMIGRTAARIVLIILGGLVSYGLGYVFFANYLQ
jgi:hypothetical protein